jgi:hypothetical protein
VGVRLRLRLRLRPSSGGVTSAASKISLRPFRTLQLIVLFTFLTACDFNREAINSSGTQGDMRAEASEERASDIDSFRIGNKEIRDEVIALFQENSIQHTVNDDNSISYHLDDGDQIDRIYTEVRLAYIRRN